MSNRLYRESKIQSMEKDIKQVFAKVAIGASGAPTVSAVNSKGISSMTRTSAGLYRITFGTPASSTAATKDVFKKLLIANLTIHSGATGSASPNMSIVTNSSGTAGSCFIDVVMTVGGVATDPASGDILYLQFLFCDSNT